MGVARCASAEGGAAGDVMSWRGLWRQLNAPAREAAVAAFYDSADSPRARRALLHLFARGLNMREQTLERWPRERLIQFVARHGELAMPDGAWPVLFTQYIAAHRLRVLDSVYRHLNIEPPAKGYVPSLSVPILPEAARACVRAVSAEFDAAHVRLVIGFLRLYHEAWAPLAAAIEAEQPPAVAPEPPPVEKDPLQVLQGFTTVDRIVIEHIVATSSQAETALTGEEIDDLVHTLIALNPLRKRSYFTLGYADVLVAGRRQDFSRPEFDDERRSWYLAGVLLGLARQNRIEELGALVKARADDFRRAAALSGPGAAMARALLPDLVAAGCISEAALLIERQAGAGGLNVANVALQQVVARLRAGNAADAMTLVRPLWDVLGNKPLDEDTDDAQWAQYRRDLARRAAQCLQAHGDFEEAERRLATDANGGDEEHQARVLADRGLVAARFRSVFELTLPATADERHIRVEALQRGEPLFRAALELRPGRIVTALLALGLLQYLRWRLDAERDPQRRDEAIALLEGAIAQMRLTDAAPTYARSGLLGQALFMRTVLLMHRLEAVDVNAALQAWREITPEAGKFPSDDLRLLLEVADMIGEDYAREFAESIWRLRRHEALDLLLPAARLQHSGSLRQALHQHALDASTPRTDRRRIWFALIPALLQARELEAATRGLDALEELAEGDDGLAEVMQFFATSANYDPAWSEQEAMWVQLRLARRAGDDAAAARYLEWLFYRVRDGDPDLARQILETAVAWRLSPDLLAQLQDALPAAPEEPSHADAESRLRHGETLRVVFVGGNETQAQYDERIRASLRRDYPGLQVTFHHTGWTSNWGQQLPGLVRDCNAADAVVLMTMMRTMLGQQLRAQLRRPWVACAARGEAGLQRSIVKAAYVALATRVRPDADAAQANGPFR